MKIQVLSPAMIQPETGTPQVLFFSGKGGVGKTTLAGTASMRLAEAGYQVLVASTDPAHSLSDLFDQPIGGKNRNVAHFVDAVEIDAPSTVDNMLEGLGALGETSGVAAAADLLKLASQSPGIDEIVSLDLLLKLIEQPSHDALVLDTAPTGHTLRLLALPELMDKYFGRMIKWRGQFAKLSRRFRRLFRSAETMDAEELGEELEGARNRMQMLGDLLRDPERCSLILVTIPEALGILETSRTFQLLASQRMPVAGVAVNMLQPETDHCSFCEQRRNAQLKQIDHARKIFDGVPLMLIDHEIEEPRGPGALQKLADKVWDGNDRILIKSASLGESGLVG